jgi:carboxymethylenebutenolidase
MKTSLPLTLIVALAGCAAKPAAPPEGVRAEAVAYPAGKEMLHGYLCRPAGDGRRPGLVAIHGDRGLNAWTKQQARRLAGRGFVVLAVDLYHGELPGDQLDAHIMDRGLPDDQVLGELKAAVDGLTRRPDVRADALGVIGWGMGGGYALDAALHDPRLRAVVTCSGRLTTDSDWLKPLNASVLGLFAARDEGITADTVRRFRAAMRTAGKRLAGLHVYADAGHDFFTPSSPHAAPGDAAARVAARKRIDAYLAAELGR